MSLVASAQEPAGRQKSGGYPPVIAGATVETYRTVGDVSLKVWIFAPARKGEEPLPAIVFFFGGGWTGGTPAQFEPQCRHLASRGMIALVGAPNPGVVMAPFPGLELAGFGAGRNKIDFGCEPVEISPIHHVKKGTPPTIIFHGKADAVVPYATVAAFADVMKAAGSRCDLIGYEGQPHAFFNKARDAETLAAADAFLVSLGYLPAATQSPATPPRP